MKICGFSALALLKLDIEGFEYGFIDALIDSEITPPQIALEVHHFLPGISISRSIRLAVKLRSRGYRLVHKHRYDLLFVHRGGT